MRLRVFGSEHHVKKDYTFFCPLNAENGLFNSNGKFKDIVQPKKRGVKRGMNRFVSTSYTIADIFFEHLKG
jgi:hypothetical protein